MRCEVPTPTYSELRRNCTSLDLRGNPLSPFDLPSSFTLAGPFGLALGAQWAQQPTPRFDARAISVVTQYPHLKCVGR